MKIFISADIEGVTGTTHWDEADKNKSDYAEFQQQMTAEVNAACKAALELGATEIWVKDAHASGRNLIASKLPQEVKLVRGWSGHPFSMVQELDETFHALLLIGYHSAAGFTGSPLAHTISGEAAYIKINQNYASEFLLHAYAASLVNVPVVFLSGDAEICGEAKKLLPDIVTVAVKRGLGASTVNLHPQLALEKIQQGVEEALKNDLTHKPIELPEHFQVEIKYKSHTRAYPYSFYPGASLKEPDTIYFETNAFFEVLRLISFVT